jgi:hypothetical protein
MRRVLSQIDLYFDTIQGVDDWQAKIDTAEATARQAVHLLLASDDDELGDEVSEPDDLSEQDDGDLPQGAVTGIDVFVRYAPDGLHVQLAVDVERPTDAHRVAAVTAETLLGNIPSLLSLHTSTVRAHPAGLGGTQTGEAAEALDPFPWLPDMTMHLPLDQPSSFLAEEFLQPAVRHAVLGAVWSAADPADQRRGGSLDWLLRLPHKDVYRASGLLLLDAAQYSDIEDPADARLARGAGDDDLVRDLIGRMLDHAALDDHEDGGDAEYSAYKIWGAWLEAHDLDDDYPGSDARTVEELACELRNDRRRRTAIECMVRALGTVLGDEPLEAAGPWHLHAENSLTDVEELIARARCEEDDLQREREAAQLVPLSRAVVALAAALAGDRQALVGAGELVEQIAQDLAGGSDGGHAFHHTLYDTLLSANPETLRHAAETALTGTAAEFAVDVAEVLDEIAGDDPGDAYDTLHGVLETHLGESRRQGTSAETVRSALEVVAAGGVDDGALPQLMARSTELGCVTGSVPFDRDDEITLELAIGTAAPLSVDLACVLAAGRAGEADDPRTTPAAQALAAAWWDRLGQPMPQLASDPGLPDAAGLLAGHCREIIRRADDVGVATAGLFVTD